MSNPPSHCLECNAPLSAAETHGLCARCLLKLGFASQFGEPSVSAAGHRLSVPPPLMPFEFGEYRVLKLLGRGGMGAVYEAEHLETGRRVALKVLGHSIDSAEARKRFIREGRLAASVSHPNSVYIYGTEEIEGAPVIAMELAAGGTLRDLIKKRGPLPPREAVDLILQVIAGLQTAQAAGVLHRDVKPANCFVTPEGAVKVGDFGLSVSTLARSDSQLTASGVMLGTPSYAPPEQLRADELDVRADIYSVGATLYALLTGRAPFDGDNAVQVVAAVLDKQPKPISEFRTDVPAALGQVVMRCLEKKRENRFANYAELREALFPFSSEAPEPALPGIRFVAGVIDETLVFLPYLSYAMFFSNDLANEWLGSRDPRTFLLLALYMVFRVSYFGITEGLWGAGLGKLLCGLRVVRPGHGAPGIARATARVAILTSTEVIGYAIQFLITDAQTFRNRLADDKWMVSDVVWIFFVLFFVTMRRRNGFAAVHDLVTGTRVIVKTRSLARPRLAVPSVGEPPGSNDRIGPYLIAGALPAKGWSIAFDQLLRRSVWIKEALANEAQINETRRAVSRPGRLRWLGGTRTADKGWDSFEAPPGVCLTQLPPNSQKWSAVRHWLADLTSEIEAATNDNTLPRPVTLDHVWVTSDGRAMLLEEPIAGHSSAQSTEFSVGDITELQKFLDAVAGYATDRNALPLEAQAFLQRLANRAFDRATFIAGNLQSLLTKPTEVTRRRRMASMLLAPAIFLLASAGLAIGIYHYWKHGEMTFRKENPAQSQLIDGVRLYAQLTGEKLDSMELIGPESAENKAFAESIGKWTAYRYGDFIRDTKFDSAARALTEDERGLARQIVEKFPNVSEEEFKGLDAIVPAGVNDLERYTRVAMFSAGPAVFGVLLVFMAIVNLVSVAAFGTSPGLRLFGMCVVDHGGKAASRARHFLRNLLAYSALPGLCLFMTFAEWMHNSAIAAVLCMGIAVVGCILSSIFFICALVWPDRSLHDRIAGTRIVLR
jgi:eukaryotic-like serine/threonine-protein kinase